MKKFRNAVDFYLNHTFDLNKLLTFTKFYSAYANSSIRNLNLKEASEVDKTKAFANAFGQLEQLVDIGMIFRHLSDKIGTKQFIDPVTKQDPMQNLIDFYAQENVQAICRLS